MIQTYFGNGKGKTTAAVGSAIRFAGCGNKVLFVQFLKNNDSAEFKVLEDIDSIDVLHSHERYELYDNKNKDHTQTLAKEYNKLLFEDVTEIAERHQMIVLDEILDAVNFGYIDEEKFLQMLSEMKNDFEIILTGHVITEKIKNISDYVSEVKNVKHPYNNGICARKGIEY